ncbi:MAG: 16S rRNA (cytidine(1402)-2'-O)-methyltransferase [Desulfitobacteriia bacterium]|jgi:16S rRNA (cytidine1402-2'-O)-methyltransferase
MAEAGLLSICATPIGNLSDITLRVLETLKTVDFIAAEDTRHSRKLLNHYGIKTPLLSYYQHNERQRTAEIIQRLKKGENGALISDAGMPGISDPGQVLIQQCLAENIKIDVLPGPNAALTALVLSGMPTESFLYLGFLPSGKGERRQALAKVAELPYTLIFYEAPHRLLRTLEDILEILGEREAVVARELTKLHQTVHRGLISELLAEFRAVPVKGECCLLLAPYVEPPKASNPAVWLEELKKLETAGVDTKEAMKTVALEYGIRKRDIYQARLEDERKKGR